MNSGWTKIFNDGTFEQGYDALVEKHLASWRNGRSNGLVGVNLVYNSVSITFGGGEGVWWQSDTLISRFNGTNQPGLNIFTNRRIEKQIGSDDLGKVLFRYTQTVDDVMDLKRCDYIGIGNIKMVDELEETGFNVSYSTISFGDLNKWVVVDYDLPSNTVNVSIENNKS